MARWRLLQKHYLNVPGTDYSYTETTGTGRVVKRNFEVPMYLDPEDPGACNYNPGGEYRAENQLNNIGELIVAHATGAEKPRDIIFVGDPTPDMLPLDDEAREISAQHTREWGRAFMTENEEGGFSDRLLLELTETLGAFNATSRPSGAVPDPEFAEMKAQIKQLIDMNMALIASLKPTAEPSTITRRV